MSGVYMTTTTLEGKSVFQRSSSVVCRPVGAESILVPIRNNVGNLDFVYTLSPVAAHIWSLLDGEKAQDEIVEAVCEDYDVDRATAQADVSALLADLMDVSLVSRVS